MKRLILIAAIAVAACSGAEPASTKYVQTWTKDYATTTCADWHQEMTSHQRFVMAADMLLSAHRREQADAEIPSDILVSRFETAIGGACSGSGEDMGIEVTTIAASLYAIANDLGPGDE